MRRLPATALVLVITSSLALAQKGGTPRRPRRPAPGDAAIASLLQVDREFAKTGASKNLEAFMDFVAEDARFYSAGVMRTGKLAFRENWAKSFADPNWSISWAPLFAEAGESADLGYSTGSFEIHDKESDGTPIVRKGSYVTIWRKQPDGRWKLALDIGSYVPPKSQ